MITVAIYFTFACFGVSLLLNLWHLTTAQGIGDRVLALDTMVINSIALLILYGISAGTAVYFEASMLFAMVGFVATVAYCKFMLRGDIIE
jgi:multicomponent K+:H+ antiporter subunit F